MYRVKEPLVHGALLCHSPLLRGHLKWEWIRCRVVDEGLCLESAGKDSKAVRVHGYRCVPSTAFLTAVWDILDGSLGLAHFGGMHATLLCTHMLVYIKVLCSVRC